MIRMIAEKFAKPLVLALSFFTLNAHATENWVRYQDYKINLNAPKDWKIERDLYGMPITVLGPERKGGERAVLNVQHSPLNQFKFDHGVIAATQSAYFAGRKEWLDAIDNTSFLSEIPYEKLSLPSKVDGFQIGFKYIMHNQEFEERSIQIVCRDRLYFVKTLYSAAEPKADQKVLADMVQQLNCAPVTKADGPYVPSNLQDFDVKYEKTYGVQWPNQQQLKGASVESKAAMLESVVDFYKKYEEGMGEDLYSSNEQNSRFKALYQKLFANTAFAADDYDCFYAGWPSKKQNRNGHETCVSPADVNPDYAKAGSSCSGTNQLACNPALFGDATCISIGSATERAHATFRCEATFKAKGKSYEDIVKDPKFDNSLFQQTIQSAETVCGGQDYVSSNYVLCSTLKDKLNISIAGGKKDSTAQDQSFIAGLDQVKPKDYDKAVTGALDNYAEFEKRCFDDKKNFKPESDPNMDPLERERCLQDLNRITDDMNQAEHLHAVVENEVQQSDQSAGDGSGGGSSGGTGGSKKGPGTDPSLNNKNCTSGNFCGSEPKGATVDPTEDQNCTKEENARIKAEPCTAGTYLKAFGQAGVAIVKSLLSSVKFLGELATDACVYVKDKFVSGWNYFFGTKKVENQTGNKAHQASATSNSFISQLKRDPWGTIANFFQAMVAGMTDFLKNDIFCAKWSDWKQTKCLVPGNFSCMSCQTRAIGIGTAAGYIAAEFVPSLLTGGVVATGAKIAEFIEAGKASGRFAKIGAEMASKFPRLAKLGNKARELAKLPGKIGERMAEMASKTKVVKFSGKVLNGVKTAYKVSAAAIKAFKSRIFGTFKNTVDALNKLKARHWSLKAGIWVAKFPVDLAVGIVKLPYHAYKTKAMQYLLSPLRVGPKAAGFEKGLQYGQRWLKVASVSDRAASIGKFAGVALPYAKYLSGAVDNINTAVKEESTQINDLDAWTEVLPKVTKGQDLTDKELQSFASHNKLTIEQAKFQLTDGKMNLLMKGVPVKFSDAEIHDYAVQQAKQAGGDPTTVEQSIRATIEEKHALKGAGPALDTEKVNQLIESKVQSNQPISPAELQNFAKANNSSVDDAQDQILNFKIMAMKAGKKVEISDAEIHHFAVRAAEQYKKDPKELEKNLKTNIRAMQKQ